MHRNIINSYFALASIILTACVPNYEAQKQRFMERCAGPEGAVKDWKVSLCYCTYDRYRTTMTFDDIERLLDSTQNYRSDLPFTNRGSKEFDWSNSPISKDIFDKILKAKTRECIPKAQPLDILDWSSDSDG